MRGVMRWLMAVTLVAIPTMAWAHEGHDEHEEMAAGEQELVGEVVDVVCYLGHGALGSGHVDCAQKCIKSGLPVAIKVGDKLYLATKSDHTPANEMLVKYAGQQVEVHGKVLEGNGQRLIEISSVEPSAGTPTTQAMIYTCPMHSEVRQPAPGACPKCGMPLQPAAASSGT